MVRRKGENMGNVKTDKLEILVKKEQEGTYFGVKFQVPENIEALEISYSYPRFWREKNEKGEVLGREQNIIDLAVNGPEETYIGSSGSNRSSIRLSPYGSSQGFAPCEILPGTWQIILGAYKVQDQGCPVTYEFRFFEKERRLYKGDTHMHTTGSDGNCELDEIAELAKKEGLDYIFITDHNNYAHNTQIRSPEGITVLPGAEWTHYKGHAGMLGVERPFDNAFCVNDAQEMEKRLKQAKERGALRVLNHPFCPNCGWRWGLEKVDYDLIEVWNGATPDGVNRQCLDWWESQLKQGKQIAVTGGSDFHKVEYGRMIASPCTCLFAMSRTREDLMEALRKGHGFVVYSPDGPMVSAEAGGFLMGDVIPSQTKIHWHFWNLQKGDRIVLLSDREKEVLLVGDDVKEVFLERTPENGSYVRAEVWRGEENAEKMPVLLTNPFYLVK